MVNVAIDTAQLNANLETSWQRVTPNISLTLAKGAVQLQLVDCNNEVHDIALHTDALLSTKTTMFEYECS